MKLIRGFYNCPRDWSGCVVTIGNFDGLHLGHQALITECVRSAKKLGLPSVLMTFEPYPQKYFSKDASFPRLMSLRDKAMSLQLMGIDYLCILRFDAELAALSPDDFVRNILVDQLKMKSVVVGDDFRFGAKRAGDFECLDALGRVHEFEAKQLPTFFYQNKRVSSSWLRSCLQSGDLELAKALLSHPYRLSGRVVKGDQRGRDFGFPTANVYVGQTHLPLSGVFVVWVFGLGVESLPGVASVGKRPMFPGKRDFVEVYLLDFDRNVYGEHLCVEFLSKLRDEEKYESVEGLVLQIERDVEGARGYFGL